MAQALRASSPKEVEERTKAYRDKRRTVVVYRLGCSVENNGISGHIEGQGAGNAIVSFNVPGGQSICLREDQIEDVKSFLSFALNECQELRRAYERVGGGTGA